MDTFTPFRRKGVAAQRRGDALRRTLTEARST